MPIRLQLHAEPREMLGKKVRRLRKTGVMPATVYGFRVEPQSIQLDAKELRDVIRRAGSTQLIDLVVGSGTPRPVLVRQVAIDAKRNAMLHVEFFQPNMRQELTSHVPVHVVGDSQAVRDGGILLTVLDHVDISSLPDAVPAGGIEADISTITEINAAIHAGDLSLPEGVTLVTPADEVVVKVNPAPTEEAVEAVLEEEQALPDELGGDEPRPDAVPEA